MPVYVYAPVKEKKGGVRSCQTCAQPFEVVQRMSEDALTGCPACAEEHDSLRDLVTTRR